MAHQWTKQIATADVAGALSVTFTDPEDAVTRGTMAEYIQALTPGGAVTVTLDGGESQTITMQPGGSIPGRFVAITASACDLVVGTGPAPEPIAPDGTAVGTAITDAGNYFAATDVEGALQEVRADLAATTNGNGASLIGIEDVGTYFAATTVEGALQEIRADLAATTNGNGASLVGIEDAATLYTAANVEAALAEVKLLADAATPILKKTLTADHTTITAAAASEALNIGTALPANSRIVGVDMHTLTVFSGGTVGDFTVDVGTAGDVDALVDGADLFAAAVDGGPSAMPAGIRPNKLYAGGGQLIATFRCGSDDVGDASAGAVTIDVLYTVVA